MIFVFLLLSPSSLTHSFPTQTMTCDHILSLLYLSHSHSLSYLIRYPLSFLFTLLSFIFSGHSRDGRTVYWKTYLQLRTGFQNLPQSTLQLLQRQRRLPDVILWIPNINRRIQDILNWR